MNGKLWYWQWHGALGLDEVYQAYSPSVPASSAARKVALLFRVWWIYSHD